MRVLVFSTLAAARTACSRINTHMGYPSAGVNAATGVPVNPGDPGWTVAYYTPTRITDTNGEYGPAGTVYFVAGPITPAMENRIQQLANPPTIVTIPNSIVRRGRRWTARIASWTTNLPDVAEDPFDLDEDAGI